MPQVLALKWRPQVFADMVGQEAVTRTLQNAIRSGHLAHAYIFAGPRGVGKTTTARLFAKALNCRSPKETEPCNACDICEEINQGTSMDVIEIDAASVNGVDGIRSLQETVGTYPAKAKYKVYIFDEAHRISSAAFDAFLKTLEEPPAHVIFIMASTEIHKFPETVQSRCQRFEFRSMGMDVLTKQLRRISDSEKIEVDDKALYQIARSAGGSMRDAQRTLDQLVAFSGRKVTLEDVRLALGIIDNEVYLKIAEAAAKQDAPAALSAVKGVLESGKDLEHFYVGLAETFRHLLVAKAFPSSASELIPLSADETRRIVELSSQMDETQMLSSLRLLIEQEWVLRHTVTPSIVLETAVLELCRLKQIMSVAGLLDQIEKDVAPSFVNSRDHVSTIKDSGTLYQMEKIPADVPVEGEAVLAVEDIEDPVEAEISPEMAKLKAQWRELLDKVGERNKALQGILADTRPKNLEEGTLVLVCNNSFIHESISKGENKHLTEKLLEEVVGRKVTLVPVLPEKTKSEEAPAASPADGPRAPKSQIDIKKEADAVEKEEPIVASAVKIFGAKIVEVKRNNNKSGS
jgi:DNA polymerase-3 subunit gamma/tau